MLVYPIATMATDTTKKQAKIANERPGRLRTELWGLLLSTLALCLLLALISFSPAEGVESGRVFNLIGPVGAQFADGALRSIGLCAFFLDAALFFVGFSLLFGRRLRASGMELGGYALAVPTGAILLNLAFDGERILGHRAGGYLGELGTEIGRSLMGTWGTVIVTSALLLLAITLISETHPSALALRLGGGIRAAAAAVGRFFARLAGLATGGLREQLGRWRTARAEASAARRQRKRERLAARAAAGHAEGPEVLGDSGVSSEEQAPSTPRRSLFGRKSAATGPAPLAAPEDTEAAWASAASATAAPSAATSAPSGATRAAARPAARPAGDDDAGDTVPDANGAADDAGRRPLRITEPPAAKRKRVSPSGQINLELERRTDSSGFELPSTTLLAAPTVSTTQTDHEALRRTAEQLEQALLEFKIKGHVTGITPGPVVTMFEFEPAPGVKLSTISNLSADLARVIRAQSVRIVAPIPGKGVVGLEVPNQNREMVFLRELLEDASFRGNKCKLPLAIGKDISGEPVVTDLARMPHLLVAGATGSGKSVAVNTMVTSLLYTASPQDVRMIMVDPKMLELSIYEGIPHLLVPVVTDPNKAATALKWAVDEMERRYHLLSDMKVRNITGYNKEIERIIAEGVPEGEDVPQRMPFIVIIIDEFADLMMVASKDVEICVARLAQKARAAGVHLILATQRPSVDVITGLIKANFPTRISFRVFSRVDSRTVLDTQGAENLLGMGDMLFRPPGRGDLVRVHGAYVDEKEIDRVVEALKAQGEPEYLDEILMGGAEDDEDLEPDEIDEMYDRAVELVTQTRKASISMVQRKLRVGYNRAARMIEMMEREGVVSPSDGRGGREVLAAPPPPM